MSTLPDQGQHLQQRIRATLRPSRGAQRVCRRLGLATLAQLVAMPRERFSQLGPDGAAAGDELDRRLRAWLAESLLGAGPTHEDRRPLLPLVPSLVAARALAGLGITTVADFLATPRRQILACRGIGQRTFDRIQHAIERTRPTPASQPPLSLLPEALCGVSLARLNLSWSLLQQLANLGCTTVGHALALPGAVFGARGELGSAGAAALRTGLQQLLQTAGAAAADAPPPEHDWPTLRGRLFAALDDQQRQLLCERIGYGTDHRTARQEAARSRLQIEAVLEPEEAVRRRLLQRVPSLFARLRQEVEHELEVRAGIVHATRLPADSMLQVIADGARDPALPLQLCAFAFPHDFHCHGAWLSRLSGRVLARLLPVLRRLTPPRLLPRPLDELLPALREVVDPLPRGPLAQLLSDDCRARIEFDAAQVEVVAPLLPSRAARLYDLLHEAGHPLRFEDLLFAYRERFRVASRRRLQSVLRAEAAFVELEPGLFSLRTWHHDELQTAAELAERTVKQIDDAGGRHHVADLLTANDPRMLCLVLDLLRDDARLRYLGRGDFCPAGHVRSHALEQLLGDFRRAAGEVVYRRFVDNQPPGARRLVRRLLDLNRLFVFPAPDRIDVLTNYPFNEERVQRLVALVDAFLRERSGYAPLPAVVAAVNATDLGGNWLSPILLGEVLRRHGPFEVLPGAYVARDALGLGNWLAQRVRNALRSAPGPISLQEILAERPELTEFSGCLFGLLQQDPLVQTPDGTRFQMA